MIPKLIMNCFDSYEWQRLLTKSNMERPDTDTSQENQKENQTISEVNTRACQ